MHRGRFAPSPTGSLHLGNARSALLGWLWARSQRGEFLLRIEDLDAARCRPEHVQTLLDDLAYLGLDFDGAPLFQSKRKDVYDGMLEDLAAGGLTYPCVCTRAEIARASSAPHGPLDDGPRYPGTCAQGVATSQAHRPPALRFRAAPGPISFQDDVHGTISLSVQATVGDFVVRRNDGAASYQLAVVADDHASGITHVLRGDDLLSSTPRQLLLYQAMGWAPPRFAHVGLVVGPDGKRMSKREGASALADLRRAGVSPDKVVGLLARWSNLSDGSPTTARQLISRFSLEHVHKGPVAVTDADLEQALGYGRDFE